MAAAINIVLAPITMGMKFPIPKRGPAIKGLMAKANAPTECKMPKDSPLLIIRLTILVSKAQCVLSEELLNVLEEQL